MNVGDIALTFLGNTRESDIIKEALALDVGIPLEHIVQVLADLSTCIKLGNCELPIKHFKYVRNAIMVPPLPAGTYTNAYPAQLIYN